MDINPTCMIVGHQQPCTMICIDRNCTNRKACIICMREIHLNHIKSCRTFVEFKQNLEELYGKYSILDPKVNIKKWREQFQIWKQKIVHELNDLEIKFETGLVCVKYKFDSFCQQDPKDLQINQLSDEDINGICINLSQSNLNKFKEEMNHMIVTMNKFMENITKFASKLQIPPFDDVKLGITERVEQINQHITLRGLGFLNLKLGYWNYFLLRNQIQKGGKYNQNRKDGPWNEIEDLKIFKDDQHQSIVYYVLGSGDYMNNVRNGKWLYQEYILVMNNLHFTHFRDDFDVYDKKILSIGGGQYCYGQKIGHWVEISNKQTNNPFYFTEIWDGQYGEQNEIKQGEWHLSVKIRNNTIAIGGGNYKLGLKDGRWREYVLRQEAQQWKLVVLELEYNNGQENPGEFKIMSEQNI